jgi:Protein of unknown function (DUF3037)
MISCEYFLVQYVPFPREELRVPIGLILLDGAGNLVRHGLARDWRTVRCLDPRADLALLRSLPGFLDTVVEEHRASDSVAGGGRLRRELFRMAESHFGAVQIARPRGVETEDPVQEFDRLFDEHVASRSTPPPRSAPPAGSRRWILSQLREALQPSPFWARLRTNIPVEEFTAPGDRFQIDFSYQPNGVTKYLHALSLDRDSNQAKVLSYTFAKIRARIPASLTAIVADASPQGSSAQSCRKILLDSGISIHPLTALDGLLDEMQKELGPPI